MLRLFMRGWMKGLGGAALIATAVAAAGCGGGGSDTPGGGETPGGTGGEVGTPTVTTGPYQPLDIGARWTYAVNDASGNYTKTSVVEATEDMGGPKAGMMGTRVREMLATEIQLTWYAVDGDRVARHHEQTLDAATSAIKQEDWYAPSYLRVDGSAEHTTGGATFSESYTDARTDAVKQTMENKAKTVEWKVEATDEAIAVPAGTFAALRLRRTDKSDGSFKTYWFVRGIGKVREQGDNQHREELTSYEGLPAATAPAAP